MSILNFHQHPQTNHYHNNTNTNVMPTIDCLVPFNPKPFLYDSHQKTIIITFVDNKLINIFTDFTDKSVNKEAWVSHIENFYLLVEHSENVHYQNYGS